MQNNLFQASDDEDKEYAETEIHQNRDNMSIYHHWWFTDYASDIAEKLYEKEKFRPSYNHQSPQISYRPHLINLICLVAEQKNLSNTAVHVGVFLLDLFMDNHNIAVERLNLVALVCLQLGAKLEDRDVKVPKLTDLNTLINNQYPLKDYVLVEIMIMKFFTFNIAIPTSAHFIEYFIFLIVTENDYNEMKDKYVNYKHLKFVARDTVFEFLDISLKDIEIVHTTPSIIAAAIICASREYLRLSVWPPDLKTLTTYDLEEIEPYVKILLKLRESLSKKRKLTSPNESNYKLENMPENTPKRFKCSDSKTVLFQKPKPVE